MGGWFIFFEMLNAYCDPLAIRAAVASDQSLLVLLLLTMPHDLYLKQIDEKTAFINSYMSFGFDLPLDVNTHLGTHLPSWRDSWMKS